MNGEIVCEEIPWGNVECVNREERGGGGEGGRGAEYGRGHLNKKFRCNLDEKRNIRM